MPELRMRSSRRPSTSPTDITLSDLKAAAKGHDMEVEEAADNIHNAARELKQAGKIS